MRRGGRYGDGYAGDGVLMPVSRVVYPVAEDREEESMGSGDGRTDMMLMGIRGKGADGETKGNFITSPMQSKGRRGKEVNKKPNKKNSFVCRVFAPV